MPKSQAAALAAPKSLPDRRLHERQTMVLRVGILEHHGRTTFCMVKNISPFGVQVRLFGSLVPGTHVQLRIGDEGSLPGRLVWAREELAGILFDDALDPSALLRVTNKLEAAARRRSSPRVATAAPLVLRTDGKAYPAELHDISASGARVRTGKPVSLGHSITLDLAGLPSLKAFARWTDGSDVGLVFEAPIPIQILAQWLDLQSSAKVTRQPPRQ